MADGEIFKVTNWHFIPLVKGGRGMFRLLCNRMNFSMRMEHPPGPLRKGENFWNFFIIFAPIKRKNHDNQ